MSLALPGQLVAERGERLVGGQGATRGTVATAAGRGGGTPPAAPVATLGPGVVPAWQVDDPIGSTWGYTSDMRVSGLGPIVAKLADTAGKGGATCC